MTCNIFPVSAQLSFSSSTSISSSPMSDRSDVQRHRDQQHIPYLTNGGGDPAVTTSFSPHMSPNEDESLQPSIPLPTRPHRTNEGVTPIINSSPKHRAAGTPIRSKSSHLADIPCPPIINQSDANCSSSHGSPQHRLVKSKTPPPKYEVHLSPMKYKYKSVDSSPSDLQLFNTLLGDRVPGDIDGGKGVKLNGHYGGKGVNSTGTLFTYPHGNHTRV